jgi:hypothetical protein
VFAVDENHRQRELNGVKRENEIDNTVVISSAAEREKKLLVTGEHLKQIKTSTNEKKKTCETPLRDLHSNTTTTKVSCYRRREGKREG